MGVEVKLEMNTALPAEITAAVDRGLLQAGKTLLALSDTLVPVEAGAPKHGVHGRDTGFTRIDQTGAEARVAVGYEAFWLVWQHERMDYKHPNGGQAKFLETAMIEGSDTALELVAAELRKVFAE